MPRKIIIFRHGQTDHNFNRIAQGWLNTSLNELGHLQAQKLARRLMNQKIDAIYSSDLRRALQTAKKVAKNLNIKINKTKLLRERNQGIFSGRKMDDLQKNLGDMYRKYKDQTEMTWKEHGGESRQDVRNRVENFLTLLHKKHPDKTIAISTHGGPKRELLRTLGLIKDANVHLDNGSVSIITKTKNGTYKLKIFNNTDHPQDDDK